MSDSNSIETQPCSLPFTLGVSDFSTSEPLLNAETIIASGMGFIEPGLAKISAMKHAHF